MSELTKWFRGTTERYEHSVPKGKNVTRSKPYALSYAQRAMRKTHEPGYVYVLSLDSTNSVKKIILPGDTEDYVLTKDTIFEVAIPVNEKLIKDCASETKAITDDLT